MASQHRGFSSCFICHAKLPRGVVIRRASYPVLREEKQYAYLRSHSAHASQGDLVCTLLFYAQPFIFDNFRVSSDTAMLPFFPWPCSRRYVLFRSMAK
jgi:hypothetical protein